jgi:hypothetical protein
VNHDRNTPASPEVRCSRGRAERVPASLMWDARGRWGTAISERDRRNDSDPVRADLKKRSRSRVGDSRS